ncbi:MAG: hypothetical protein M3Y55_03265, partial [Pseudomonadota bacterium]|nr:hypothetical protein [Pseudomonadota bacterium]
MNEIEKLAAEYFERFESLALYPGLNTREFWLAVAGVAIFVLGLVWYLRHGSGTSHDSPASFLAIFVSDGALIGSGVLVQKFHKSKTLELANRGRGSNLQTV